MDPHQYLIEPKQPKAYLHYQLDGNNPHHQNRPQHWKRKRLVNLQDH